MSDAGKGKHVSRSFITVLIAVACAVVVIFNFILFLPWIRTETEISDYGSTIKELVIAPGESYSFSVRERRDAFDKLCFIVNEQSCSGIYVTLSSEDDSRKFYEGEAEVFNSRDDIRGEFKTAVIKGLFDRGSYKLSIKNTSDTENLIVNLGEKDTLVFSTLKSSDEGYYVLFPVAVILLVYAVMITAWLKNSEFKAGSFFLLSAIPLAAAYMIIFPQNCFNDAYTHYLAVYRLSNVFLGRGGDSEWLARTGDANFFLLFWRPGINPGLREYTLMKDNLSLMNADASFADFVIHEDKMKFYSFLSYLPHVIGLVAARLIGFGPLVSAYVSRIFMMAFYVFFCHRAINRIPKAKFLLAMLSLTPVTLSMSSAFSYDGMVYISSINFLAGVFAASEELKAGKKIRCFVECSIWAFILGGVKGGGYIMLILLAFIIIRKGDRRSYVRTSVIVGSSILSILIFDVIVPALTKISLFQLGGTEEGYLTSSFAVTNPLEYFFMAVNGYLKNADAIFMSLFGGMLSWDEFVIPSILIAALAFVFGLFFMADGSADILDKRGARLAVLTVIISLVVTPAMLLSWTGIGSRYIVGVQGRYFIPVLPLVYLLICRMFKKVKLEGDNEVMVKKCSIACIAVLNCLFICFLLGTYLTR